MTDQARADLMSQMTNDAIAVTSAKTAREYLRQNGWMLANTKRTRANLVDILFTASQKKLPIETQNTIRAVAFILEFDLESDISSSLAELVRERVAVTLDTLTSDLNRTRDFLDATTKDQAAAALEIRETANQCKEISTSLAESSEKLTQAAAAPTIPERTWAQIAAAATITTTTPGSQTNGVEINPTFSPDEARVQQRIQLSARQIMIEPISLSHDTPQKFRDEINGWLEDFDATNVDTPGMKTLVRGITIQERGGILLELDSEPSALRFRSYAQATDLLTRFGPGANISEKPVQVILRFVPCNGGFDPSDCDHLHNIESDLGLNKGSITAANWIKKPERRAPNQSCANVKLTCATPQIGNTLLTERLYIAGSLVKARKDLKEPMRCNNCQEYGHLRDDCPNEERCATCTGTHSANSCTNQNHPKCVSCGADSKHPSSARNCPIFLRRSDAFDKRYPENAMPYFPVPGQRWTWASSPPKQYYQPNPNPRGHNNQRPRNQDNGWQTVNRRQTTLDGALFGQLPIANQRPATPPPPPNPMQRSDSPLDWTQ